MTADQRQWTVVAGTVGTLVLALAIAATVRPQGGLVEVASPAPDFHATNLATGRPASLADYRGKVILLNVWATWCEPCRVEMPSMERVHRKFAGTDFRVVAVSVDLEDSSVVSAFARDLGLTFDILHDPTTAIHRIYQTAGRVPESWVIDREGVIVKKEIGARQWDGPVTETLIRRLLDAR